MMYDDFCFHKWWQFDVYSRTAGVGMILVNNHMLVVCEACRKLQYHCEKNEMGAEKIFQMCRWSSELLQAMHLCCHRYDAGWCHQHADEDQQHCGSVAGAAHFLLCRHRPIDHVGTVAVVMKIQKKWCSLMLLREEGMEPTKMLHQLLVLLHPMTIVY